MIIKDINYKEANKLLKSRMISFLRAIDAKLGRHNTKIAQVRKKYKTDWVFKSNAELLKLSGLFSELSDKIQTAKKSNPQDSDFQEHLRSFTMQQYSKIRDSLSQQ